VLALPLYASGEAGREVRRKLTWMCVSQVNPEKRAILPGMAFRGFASRYQRPATSEGFQDITEVAFTVRHCVFESDRRPALLLFSPRVSTVLLTLERVV
jgi:hypothetical protein